ncbi:MAG: hypothetical protein K0R24_2346 [Gammaproteobacteria bacterium]|jgi:hypothetical protein|nr:hypothetical protein [Gammaproteobacteria bacterium]
MIKELGILKTLLELLIVSIPTVGISVWWNQKNKKKDKRKEDIKNARNVLILLNTRSDILKSLKAHFENNKYGHYPDLISSKEGLLLEDDILKLRNNDRIPPSLSEWIIREEGLFKEVLGRLESYHQRYYELESNLPGRPPIGHPGRESYRPPDAYFLGDKRLQECKSGILEKIKNSNLDNIRTELANHLNNKAS